MPSKEQFSLERFDVTEIGSITAIFAARSYQAGLYVLRFADSSAYVGYTDNAAGQFLADRAEWSDIESVEFTSGSADGLDALTDFVSGTSPLRRRDSIATPLEASTATDIFPGHRAHRITVTAGSVSERRRRFWELSDHIAYPAIRSIVADYINSTIPDPANTQKYLWNVSALPSTETTKDRRRLLTLTCGSLETLYVTEITHDDDSIELDLRVNTDVPDGKADADLEVSNETVSAGRGPYTTERVWSWSIDLGALLEEDVDVDLGIDDDTFDDLAYALNSRLMSQKRSSFENEHNQDLANDLVSEAYRQISEPD